MPPNHQHYTEVFLVLRSFGKTQNGELLSFTIHNGKAFLVMNKPLSFPDRSKIEIVQLFYVA